VALLVVIGCTSTSTRENRERAMLHMQLGTGLLGQGKYPQALSELLKAEQMDPQNPAILNNLGLAYYVRGKYKLGEEKFRAAIAIVPRFTDAKNNLGRLLIDAQRVPEAIKVLQEAEGDLTYEFADKTFTNLGMAYFELSNYTKAEDYLSRALTLRRDNCTASNLYGRTLLQMQRVQQSAQALDQAIEYCRENHFEEPIFYSAMSYFSLGEKEKSRARLEELLKDYPKSKYVAKAKGMLELLQQ
jgi:type IV pilus assembly protein PilF